MAKYARMKIECRCCGKSYEANVLQSFSSTASMGLDTDPGTPAVFDRVVLCPICGYATDQIYDRVDQPIRKFVQSPGYRKYFENPDMDETYKKNVLASILYKAAGKKQQAAYFRLVSYWYAKKNCPKFSADALNHAIEEYISYIGSTVDPEGVMTLIDLLRQASEFEQAEIVSKAMEPHFPKYEFLSDLNKIEKALIEKRDSKSYTIDEVVE